jgi:hypothetical protein
MSSLCNHLADASLVFLENCRDAPLFLSCVDAKKNLRHRIHRHEEPIAVIRNIDTTIPPVKERAFSSMASTTTATEAMFIL